MQGSQEFRIEVLKVHYDLSKENLSAGILRSAVAKELGIKDYNSNKLWNSIEYLKDKGFLEIFTNMEERVTTNGVDEVENGFPSFTNNSGIQRSQVKAIEVEENIYQQKIKKIGRDKSLVIRLMPVVMVGSDRILDKESSIFLRQLCRLIDKAFNEFNLAIENAQNEINENNKLAYKFEIIDHLENSINAISRAIIIFKVASDDPSHGHSINLLDFVSQKTRDKVQNHDNPPIRNRVEHIDEDIMGNNFNGKIFLEISEDYTEICISKKCMPIDQLGEIIGDYNEFVLELLNNLPDK